MKWKKYLFDSTITYNYPDVGGLAGDDDYPTGNILMGYKVKKVPYYNRLATGFDKILDIDVGDWKWDEFEGCRGMESYKSYSDTLKNFFLSDRLFNRVIDKEPKQIPTDMRAVGGKTAPEKDAWGDKEKKIEKNPNAEGDEEEADTSHIKERIELYLNEEKVAQIIMRQIESLDRWALNAWGAKNFVGMKDGLQFDVRGSKFKGRVIIRYDQGKDLYNIELGQVRKLEWKQKQLIKQVFVEDLVNILDQHIG